MKSNLEPSNEASLIDEKIPKGQAIHYGLRKFGWVIAAGVMGYLVFLSDPPAIK